MSTIAETTIEADPKVPVIRMRREFDAAPELAGPYGGVRSGSGWSEELAFGV